MRNKPNAAHPRQALCARGRRSRAALFFTSFILTLCVLLSALGLFVVYKNSSSIGFGQKVEVFSVTGGHDLVTVTALGRYCTFDTARLKEANAVWLRVCGAASYFTPAPVRLARHTASSLRQLEDRFLSESGIFT